MDHGLPGVTWLPPLLSTAPPGCPTVERFSPLRRPELPARRSTGAACHASPQVLPIRMCDHHNKPFRLLWSHMGWMFQNHPRTAACPGSTGDLQRRPLLPLADTITSCCCKIPWACCFLDSARQRRRGWPWCSGASPLRLVISTTSPLREQAPPTAGQARYPSDQSRNNPCGCPDLREAGTTTHHPSPIRPARLRARPDDLTWQTSGLACLPLGLPPMCASPARLQRASSVGLAQWIALRPLASRSLFHLLQLPCQTRIRLPAKDVASLARTVNWWMCPRLRPEFFLLPQGRRRGVTAAVLRPVSTPAQGSTNARPLKRRRSLRTPCHDRRASPLRSRTAAMTCGCSGTSPTAMCLKRSKRHQEGNWIPRHPVPEIHRTGAYKVQVNLHHDVIANQTSSGQPLSLNSRSAAEPPRSA